MSKAMRESLETMARALGMGVHKLGSKRPNIADRGPDDNRIMMIADLLSDDRSPFMPDDEYALREMSEDTLKKLRAAYLVSEDDDGLGHYQDILIFNRNKNWVQKLKKIMPERTVVVAVGAGHLAGEKGVIKLLRKEGYTVTPVKYKIRKERS